MATSSNGYLASPDRDRVNAVDFRVAKVEFPAGVRAGDVRVILHHVARELSRRVEKPVKGWCWGYAYRPNRNNPTQLSDHSSATAIDYNAPRHPNGAVGTFSGKQVETIKDILDFCEGTVKWGGEYRFTKDEMHFGISDVTTPHDIKRVANKIRAHNKAKTQAAKVKEAVQVKIRRKPKAYPHDGVVALVLVRRGHKNGDILEVQRVLNAWYPNLDLLEDGVYGPKTAIAFVRARRYMGIKGDTTKPRVRKKILRRLGFKVI